MTKQREPLTVTFILAGRKGQRLRVDIDNRRSGAIGAAALVKRARDDFDKIARAMLHDWYEDAVFKRGDR